MSKETEELGSALELGKKIKRHERSWGEKLSWGVMFKGIAGIGE